MHAVDGHQEAWPAPRGGHCGIHAAEPLRADEMACHPGRDSAQDAHGALLEEVLDRVGVRKQPDKAQAAAQPQDVVGEVPLALVAVVLPGGPVAADALDDGQDQQQVQRIVDAVLPAEVLQRRQEAVELGEIVAYRLEEVGVVDSRLGPLRTSALATGTCSLTSCSARALISFTAFCSLLYSFTHPSTSSAMSTGT